MKPINHSKTAGWNYVKWYARWIAWAIRWRDSGNRQMMRECAMNARENLTYLIKLELVK